MTEHDNYVYEWTYDEEQALYMCVGQAMLLGVYHDDDADCWWALAWDIEPVDPRWADTDQVELLMQQEHPGVHEAMDWCEARDAHEAAFDSTTFNL